MILVTSSPQLSGTLSSRGILGPEAGALPPSARPPDAAARGRRRQGRPESESGAQGAVGQVRRVRHRDGHHQNGEVSIVEGRRSYGFLGLSWNDRTIIFLVMFVF